MESISTKHDAEGELVVVSETITERKEEVHIKIAEEHGK